MKLIFKLNDSQFLEDGEDKEVTVIAEVTPEQKERIHPADSAQPWEPAEIEDVSVDGDIIEPNEKLKELIFEQYDKEEKNEII